MNLRLGIFASHGGSNMQAIMDACNDNKIKGRVCVVICNNSGAGAVTRAENEGIPVFHLSSANYPDPGDLDEAMLLVLKKYDVNLVALAGYMKKLGPAVLREYQGRILNVHPALLPSFGGKGMYGINVHKAVIEAGERESGATIHIVDENYDSGRILSQAVISIDEAESPESLSEKVLEQEHSLYVATLAKISEGGITL
ncbi:MAG: phosphoribosylglycinamide formyltransferase [Clostridia bacterium]